VELSRKYEDCSSDLARERIAGRETQKRAAEWEREFQSLQQSVVCVLRCSGEIIEVLRET
jgi:hypothetical protein